MFDLNEERNIPTWWSSAGLLMCAGLSALTARIERPTRRHVYWVGLALMFALCSIDETLELHEQWSAPIKAALHVDGWLHYAWLVPAGLALLMLAPAYLRFLRSLPVKTRRQLMLAAALYIGGAAGVELLSGAIASRSGDTGLGYRLLTVLEESGELFGVLVFLRALLTYLADLRVTIEFSSQRD